MTLLEVNKERITTHGDFRKQFDIAQTIKNVFMEGNYRTLHPIQREALDMIATKLSRIVTGDPMHFDHWKDIAGYSALGEQHCHEIKIKPTLFNPPVPFELPGDCANPLWGTTPLPTIKDLIVAKDTDSDRIIPKYANNVGEYSQMVLNKHETANNDTDINKFSEVLKND